MRNQFFDPCFLFDFYSDRGSTATPSACSNVRWCGLREDLREGENGMGEEPRCLELEREGCTWILVQGSSPPPVLSYAADDGAGMHT